MAEAVVFGIGAFEHVDELTRSNAGASHEPAQVERLVRVDANLVDDREQSRRRTAARSVLWIQSMRRAASNGG